MPGRSGAVESSVREPKIHVTATPADSHAIRIRSVAYVELKGLTKTFGGHVAVRGLDLSLERGELVSLLGPSGCGKTTTLRMVAGFETPDDGERGRRRPGPAGASGSPSRDGRRLSELRALPAPDRLGQRRVRDEDRRAPGRRGAAAGAGAARDGGARPTSGSRYPRELSGGQQQRVALARALAMEPRMLLLDEPLSALDAVVRVAIREEIRRIQSSLGVTTLYVTHDQEEALAISDRVVVMREGTIEQVGTPEVIYAEPASPFVAGFIGKMNQCAGVVEDPARGQVRLGGTRDHACPPRAWPAGRRGASVTILLRPEAIGVGLAPLHRTPATTISRGIVDAVTFLGSVRRVAVQAAGQRLVADVSVLALRRPHPRNARRSSHFPSRPAACCRRTESGGTGAPA